MHWVNRVMTRDGKLHETKHQAKQHAEASYSNALHSLAHAMVMLTKAKDITVFIDSNLEKFIELHALKKDIELAESPGDES